MSAAHSSPASRSCLGGTSSYFEPVLTSRENGSRELHREALLPVSVLGGTSEAPESAEHSSVQKTSRRSH